MLAVKGKKKILFVANVAQEHINKFHIPSILCFQQHGWEVDVACDMDAEVPYCDHAIAGDWTRSPFTPKTIKGVHQLKKHLESHHYDVIYCHTPVGGLVARLAAGKARKQGTKVVYFAHGLHFFNGAPIINWLLFYPIERLLAKRTDAMFLINKEDYERVKKTFGVKTVRLFPGIGVNFERLKIDNPDKIRVEYRKQLGIKTDDTVLVYVAELLPNKNQEMLLDALKLIKKENENVKLLLVGPDHWDGEVEKMAKEKGLQDDVICTGWRNDIGQLMVTSNICVASSIREGFGLNLVEAMYCGLPVVAKRNRGHITVIENGKNGFLVENASEMATSIRILLNDHEMIQKFSHVDVSIYDSDIVAESIFNEVDMIVGNGEME